MSRQDTVATVGLIVSKHNIGIAAAEIALPAFPERKTIEILPHATETIFVGDSLTTCDRPIEPAGYPFTPPLAHGIKIFARASAAIADHPVTQIG